MPEMNGYETAAAIRSQYEDMNILALSMYDSEFNIIKMLRAGAQGYLLKNVQPSELRRAITDVYEHGFYHSELVTGRMLRTLHERKSGHSELNENEEQFLSLCCSELTYKEIAEKMFKAPRTIDGYREDLFAKLGITSRTGLVLYALKTGIARM
jgi:two-component system invasion response regulator UvrY